MQNQSNAAIVTMNCPDSQVGLEYAISDGVVVADLVLPVIDLPNISSALLRLGDNPRLRDRRSRLIAALGVNS